MNSIIALPTYLAWLSKHLPPASAAAPGFTTVYSQLSPLGFSQYQLPLCSLNETGPHLCQSLHTSSPLCLEHPSPRIWLTLLIPQGSASTSHPHKAFPDRWTNLTPLFYSTQCFSSECSCHSCSCISSLSNVCFLQQNISCKKLDTESNLLNAVSPASHTAFNQ